MAIRLGGDALALLAQILAARMLGAEQFGLYSLALVWLLVRGYAATSGNSSAATSPTLGTSFSALTIGAPSLGDLDRRCRGRAGCSIPLLPAPVLTIFGTRSAAIGATFRGSSMPRPEPQTDSKTRPLARFVSVCLAEGLTLVLRRP
jgi:hypothetical protein